MRSWTGDQVGNPVGADVRYIYRFLIRLNDVWSEAIFFSPYPFPEILFYKIELLCFHLNKLNI